MINFSVCKDTNPNALIKWETVSAKNYIEAASLMKEYPYSSTIFANGQRHGDNVQSFGNVVIYDIDNDKGKPQLTIEEAKEKLKQHRISAMILPSRSNGLDKKGHVAERFRIIIPTNRPTNLIDKESYREFQSVTAKALKIDQYVDSKALNDKARFYYRSPISAEPHIIKSDRVMNIDNLEARAIQNVAAAKEEKAQEQARLAKIKSEIDQYRTTTQNVSSSALTYADTNRIMQIDIKSVINHYEKDAKNYTEGSYEMVKTANAKYSVLEKNVAHDFKSDKTYNTLTYLQSRLGTTNLNKIGRELEKVTGESYTKVNIEAVKKAVENARKTATNDKTFEESIKQQFNCNYCKLEKESVKIADQEIKLKEISQSKQEIITDLQKNRAEQEAQRSRGHHQQLR